jgi:Ca2+-transporting ATPase
MALRSLTAARARVLRDGHAVMIPAVEVVPGDMLLVEPGDVVAADARLLEASELSTNEAVLTGESFPVRKSPTAVPAEAPLAERTDCVFMGTVVTTGTGCAVVEATGMSTEMGKIAHLLGEGRDGPTPLQQRLAALGHVLLVACLVLVAVVGVIGLVRGEPWVTMLLTAVSLAVSAVPEGLPAVVTVALAVGVRRMSARGVLVRHLAAVETLGCATVIATDKTGTLTTGVMAVRDVWGSDRRAVLAAAAACADADLDPASGEGSGDPTELAILRAASELGVDRGAIERENPRERVAPFDQARRRMSILRADGVLYVKGAAEEVVQRCSGDGHAALAANDAMAKGGLRVLAVARGRGAEESDLELLGLIGIADAPREEATAAIAQARAAGVHVVMITGDHPITASAIAREMNMIGPGEPEDGIVYARKTAADKTAIVRELRERGEIVAMTGDGVNDAPSIREADIGIAMGRAATEVTREAAEMVLTGDDLSGVVHAIREGRVIFDNIRKTVVYLLSANGAGLLIMLVAAAVGMPLPLLPIQLLWLNIMTEPAPGLALAVDAPDGDVLTRPPRPPKEPLLGRREWLRIAWVAALQATVVLGVFAVMLGRGDVAHARTVAFTTLVFSGLFWSFAARSPDRVFWEVGVLRNAILLLVVAASVLLQIAIVMMPWTRELLHLAPLDAADLRIALALALVPVTMVELGKLARRAVRRLRPRRPALDRPAQA